MATCIVVWIERYEHSIRSNWYCHVFNWNICCTWGQNTASQCNSITGALTRTLSTDAATGIGIVFLVIGAILGIGGAKSKEQEGQTRY